MQKLSAAVVRSGAQTLLEARCQALVMERDGRVVGVLVSQGKREHFIEARRGVVLTTGGFIWNDTMLREFAPDLLRCQHRVGTPSDDGSGIRLGIAAGAGSTKSPPSNARLVLGNIKLPASQPEHQVTAE